MLNKRKLLILDKESAWEGAEASFKDDYELVFSGCRNDNLNVELSSGDVQLVVINSYIDTMEPLGAISTIKKQGNIPVIMMMDPNTQSIDKIVALEMGADGIITKPFEWRELVARIRAHLRLIENTQKTVQKNQQISNDRLACFNAWVLHPDRMVLYSANHEPQHLTIGEFKLLQVFLSMPKTVISREELLKTSHGAHIPANDRSVDVLIARLRKKINDNGLDGIIKTVRGVGYIFDENVTFKNRDTAAPQKDQMNFYF